MARRHRSGRSLRDLRAEAEAAEARGLGHLNQPKPRSEPAQARPKPLNRPRLKVVWAVCDLGGRTVATFPYSEKAAAEAHAEQLKAKGKGRHFLRAEKVPMEPDSE